LEIFKDGILIFFLHNTKSDLQLQPTWNMSEKFLIKFDDISKESFKVSIRQCLFFFFPYIKSCFHYMKWRYEVIQFRCFSFCWRFPQWNSMVLHILYLIYNRVTITLLSKCIFLLCYRHVFVTSCFLMLSFFHEIV
jgi:hypothetical protein